MHVIFDTILKVAARVSSQFGGRRAHNQISREDMNVGCVNNTKLLVCQNQQIGTFLINFIILLYMLLILYINIWPKLEFGYGIYRTWICLLTGPKLWNGPELNCQWV